MLTLLLFILVLSLLVFVHEFGHFWTARRLGVTVEEFGFGFPPRLLGLRRGDTLYSLNAIPFGGFVRLKGEQAAASRDPLSFAAASLSRRATIIASGVLMNFLLAIVFLTVALGVGVPTLSDQRLPGARVQQTRVIVTAVLPDSPAQLSGLKAGDLILRLDGQPVNDAPAVRAVLEGRPGQAVVVELERRKQRLTLTVEPSLLDESGKARIGAGIDSLSLVSYALPWAFVNSLRQTGSLTGQMVVGLGGFLKGLVVERQISPDVAGPVGIAVLTGQVARLGLPSMIQFVALLSLSLAVINILPFPALDGGRLLFLGIERLRGQPVNRRVEGWIHNLGFVLLLVLILLVSIQDIQRFDVLARIGRVVRGIFTP